MRQIKELEEQFLLSSEQIKEIAETFAQEIQRAWQKKNSSLKNLSSHLSNATGKEKGIFLALDFGGTNVRFILLHLDGKGKFTILNKKKLLLQGNDYDYTQGKGEKLFTFLAREIKSFLPKNNKQYYLGHTFSFPFASLSYKSAVLLRWTKEFSLTDVEGYDVMELLAEALKKQGVTNINPIAILNDTVATQLTANYQDASCLIGSIIGTGHNSSYLEKDTIINLESGNFNLLKLTSYDQKLDQISENPGQQLLEKMVSGKYLGELVRLIMLDYGEERSEFSTVQMSKILKHQDNSLLKKVSSIVRLRSIQLVAASYLGILKYLEEPRRAVIAIDGDVYAKMPCYAQILQKTLAENYHGALQTKLVNDGSAIGAAIAAAICKSKEEEG